MPQLNKEANIILTLQAYRSDPELSLLCAAKIYKVNYSTLFY
jgi:hypothetical protein